MTIKEYKQALKDLSDEEFAEFKKNFGGKHETPEGYVRDFVDNPKHERRICQLLGLETEEERMVEACVSSANSAKKSAICALLGVGIALFALVVSICVAICR